MDLRMTHVVGSLRRVGARHLAAGANCQDHAVARACQHGLVLAVADGVSDVGDGQSSSEVGAWIAAEIAGNSVIGHLKATQGRTCAADVREQLATDLHTGLWPLWTVLGRRRGRAGLLSTLCVAVVTPGWSRIWAAGDGRYGLIGGAADVFGPDPRCRTWNVRHVQLSERAAAVIGEREEAGFAHFVTGVADGDVPRSGSERIATIVHDLQEVAGCVGPTLAVHVATDGVFDESGVLAALDRPVRDDEVRQRLSREPVDDDLAVAWAAERLPNSLGLGAILGFGALQRFLGNAGASAGMAGAR